MNISNFLLDLVPAVLIIALFYPLCRKVAALLELTAHKYITHLSHKQTAPPSATQPSATNMILRLKFQAYERIILFIERMKPDSLIPRTLNPALTNREYQTLLINEVRKEFEYNLSQQLYLTENAWTLAGNMKAQLTTLINTAATDCKPENPSGELAKKILEQYISSDIKVDQILSMIKSDIAIH